MQEDNRLPILYKCPYCSSGRFTAEDGWEGATRHIKEKHSQGQRKKRPERGPLLEEQEVCYPEVESPG